MASTFADRKRSASAEFSVHWAEQSMGARSSMIAHRNLDIVIALDKGTVSGARTDQLPHTGSTHLRQVLMVFHLKTESRFHLAILMNESNGKFPIISFCRSSDT